MKYLFLPIHLVVFWYAESLATFITLWKNAVLLLEEDLAVGLMLKLLFVPLFHDSTIIGKVLSFIFRSIRILMGFFSFVLATVLILALALFWFAWPFLIIFGKLGVWGWLGFFAGVGLFVIHKFSHPHKKLWQVKDSNFWASSEIPKKKVTLKNILESKEAKNITLYLETDLANFQNIKLASADELIKKAAQLAKNSMSPYINMGHFFVAALELSPNIETELLKNDLKLEDFAKCLNFLEKKKRVWRVVWIWEDDFAITHLKGINRGWLGAPTPTLDSCSVDLTRLVAKENTADFEGRANIISEVVNILSQENNKNVLLVGPPGSGRTALIKFLAKKIISGNAPTSLSTKRVVVLDLPRLLSGITSQGELAEKIKNIFEEVKFSGNVILVVEEIHALGIGEAGSQFSLYSLMEPFLDSNDFQFIGTTDSANYMKTLEKNSGFARLFTKVELPPATEEETLVILQDLAVDIERKGKIKVSFASLQETVKLASLYIRDRVMPDSALNILQEAKVEPQNGWITKVIIRGVLGQRVNIPVADLDKTQKQDLLDLENKIHQKLIDQEEAVRAVADVLRRSATGLREKNRPIGSFLFVGPTGVGKTELAKILSEIYFHTRDFFRFDMSEYQSGESINHLIESLTEEIKNKPFALILLDEFEKADSKILTIFLQILEDGRLTDANGQTIDFTNTIIIATSNAGSLILATGLKNGQTLDQLKAGVNDELLKTFKPELINRFDSIVLFKSLSENDLQKIVNLKLTILQNQLKEQGFLVEFDQTLVKQLAKRGFDSVLGARPLRRLIQDSLETNLSKLILAGKLQKGQTFKVGVEIL